MNELDKLAKKYGADKYGKHSYTPFYYELFKDRQKTVKKVIEIGIGEGASLFMWNDFFPNAEIYGADIDPERVSLQLPEHYRIRVVKCDQSSQDDLISLLNVTGSNIDLFIDDGSHKPKDQLFTCLQVFPSLDQSAIYVIEDVADPSIFQKLPTRWNIEMTKFTGRYDDRIIVVRHK